MKVLGAILAAVLSGAGLGNLHAQGTFQNLDFEHPGSPLVGGPISASIAFPGWSVYSSFVAFDDVSLGAAAITLHDTNTHYFTIPQGQYAALLQASYPDGLVLPALGQVGTVPSTAHSVRFYGDATFTLTFGGQPIPLVTLGNASGYDVFGGNISVFAGQSGELLFRGRGSLDNIFFSDEPIPEPKMVGLFNLAALLFLGWRLRSRHSCG